MLNDLWNDYQKIFTLEQRNRPELDLDLFLFLASDWTREAGLCVDCKNKFHSQAVIHISCLDTVLKLF